MDWLDWVLAAAVVAMLLWAQVMRRRLHTIESEVIALSAEHEADKIFRDRDREELEETVRRQADQIDTLQVKLQDIEQRLLLSGQTDPSTQARIDEIQQHFWSKRPGDSH
jgi:hypothetical protein